MAFVAGLILLQASACRDEHSRSQQARALLERIARIDHRAALAEREAEIAALRALPLEDPDLVALREACSAAHAGLVAAEREQAQVRARLDAAATTKLPEAELAQLSSALAHASQQLRAANTAVPDCENRTRKLVERYH